MNNVLTLEKLKEAIDLIKPIRVPEVNTSPSKIKDKFKKTFDTGIFDDIFRDVFK